MFNGEGIVIITPMVLACYDIVTKVLTDPQFGVTRSRIGLGLSIELVPPPTLY